MRYAVKSPVVLLAPSAPLADRVAAVVTFFHHCRRDRPRGSERAPIRVMTFAVDGGASRAHLNDVGDSVHDVVGRRAVCYRRQCDIMPPACRTLGCLSAVCTAFRRHNIVLSTNQLYCNDHHASTLSVFLMYDVRPIQVTRKFVRKTHYTMYI